METRPDVDTVVLGILVLKVLIIDYLQAAHSQNVSTTMLS